MTDTMFSEVIPRSKQMFSGFLWFGECLIVFNVVFDTTSSGHSPSFMQQGLDNDLEVKYCFQTNNASNIASVRSCDCVCHGTYKSKNCVSNAVSSFCHIWVFFNRNCFFEPYKS